MLRLNGTTGAFVNDFATSVEDAAGLAFGPANNLFVVNSTDPGSVTVLNATTGALITKVDAGGIHNDPEGITLGPDKNIYVAKCRWQQHPQVQRNHRRYGSGGLIGPRGVAFSPDGSLFVASFNTNQVLRYDGSTGAFLGTFVAAGDHGLNLPRDLVFGPDGNLYVGSFGSGDVFRYKGSTGAFIDDFIPVGTGDLGGPTVLLFGEGSSTATPEPSTLGLLTCGLAALAAWKRKTLHAKIHTPAPLTC